MSLTKVSYSMIEGAVANVLDYGAVGDGVADDTAALQSAIDASSAVFFPAGNYKITSALTLNVGNHLFGEDYQASRITVVGAIAGVTAIFATQTETGIVIDNLRIIGDSALSLDLLRFEKATAVSIRDCNIRQTSRSCLRMDNNCINYLIERVRFENFVEYGIHASQFSSVAVVNACQWDANAVDGIACIGLEGVESWTIIGANVNGNNFLGFIQAMDGIGGNVATRTTCIGCYVEGLRIPAFSTQGAALYDTLQVFGGLFNSSDSVQCADLSNGAAHRRIHLADIRLPTPGYAFAPGSTVEFEFLRPNIDGGGAGVVGYTTTGDVVLNAKADPKIKRYFNNTAGLAAGASAQVTINIGTDFPTTNYDFSFSIEVVGGGENGQNKNEMSYKIDDVTLSSIVFTCTRTGGTSNQSCYYYVTVFGTAT